MIHIVKVCSVVSEVEVDVFLEFCCIFYDTTDIGHLISGSSAFSKSSLCILKFSIHILSGLSFPSPGDLPHPGIQLGSPALQADSLQFEPPGKPNNCLSSVQSLSRVPLFVTPWTAACQASLSVINSHSCPLSWWCHPTISSSVVPFSSHLQPFPASGSFQISQVFASGGQSTGVSAWTSVLPMNTQDWFPLGWTGWISLQKGRSIQLFYVLCLLPAQCMPSLGVNWNLERIHIQSLLCNKMIFMKYSVLFVCYLFAM